MWLDAIPYFSENNDKDKNLTVPSLGILSITTFNLSLVNFVDMKVGTDCTLCRYKRQFDEESQPWRLREEWVGRMGRTRKEEEREGHNLTFCSSLFYTHHMDAWHLKVAFKSQSYFEC